MDSQEEARKNFRKIDRRLSVAQKELDEGNLEAVVGQCFQAVNIAKHMADDVYMCECNVNAFFVGDLSHLEISKRIQPIHKILAGLKSKDSLDNYNAITNFMIGVTNLAQRKYQLASRFMRAAADTFSEPEEAYSALTILCEAYARLGHKNAWRKTQIEAMLLQPEKDYAFKEYASGVLRRENGCLGLNKLNCSIVLRDMRKIVTEHGASSLGVIDQVLIEYVTHIGHEFKEYEPEHAFSSLSFS